MKTIMKKMIAVKPAQVLKKGSAEYIAEAMMMGIRVEVYIHSSDVVED